jgi:hypothetical protein
MALTTVATVIGFVALQVVHNVKLQQALFESRMNTYVSDVQEAIRAKEEHDYNRFGLIVDKYRDGQPLAAFRGPEWHYLERMTRAGGRE